LVVVMDFCYGTVLYPEIDAFVPVRGVKDPHDPSPECRGACGSLVA
jgi:hypothetical protein